MIETLPSPSSVITLLALLIVALLSQTWLWRRLHQRQQQLRELGQALATLEADKQRAEQANRLKGQFLGHISHEIRTPLSAFIGLLELMLLRSEADAPNLPSLQLALEAARDLRELLSDLLDITRIESGELSLNPTWAYLRNNVDVVMGVFQALAQQKNLDLSLEFTAPDPEPQVLIDVLRFKQVLSNLLSNAIKFTTKGSVQVRLQLWPATRANDFELQLQVLDTGIGIPEQQRLQLLQPFAQVDPGSQSARDSAGLGLPISHHVCQRMGGRLGLYGRSGPGCEARIELSLAGRVTCAPPPEPPMCPLAGLPLDILLADDHPASLTLLQGQLEYLGHRVSCAENGLQAYQQWQDGDFDLLIVDCNMPAMNGYQLTKAIRQDETLSRQPPVHLLGCSASHDPRTRECCLKAGMHDCLFKPLGLSQISQTLAALMPLPRADSFSLRTLQTLTRGEPTFAQQMLKKLLQCSLDDRRLLGLITPQDNQALLTQAHRIKGSALMVGADALHNACQILELACLEEAGLDAVSPAIRALDLALVRFAQSLHRHIAQAPSPSPAAAPQASPTHASGHAVPR
ncbi:response regulator [Pseudomonas sp. LD120]|uniref:response regulator n=1 Tax=Pseudomonas sp. LD120 TaxID=485751 RepID=UPI0021143866|nr:response regulator [Pseudomonas sp. LD120]